MALKQRRQQTRLEAGEEQQVAAVAGSVLIVGRLGVEFLQQLGRRRGTLGQDDDVGILLPRQASDEAVQVVPIQIPEQEPHHRPSVTEGESRFELRKDSRQLPGQLPGQLPVASYQLPVLSS